MNRMMSSGYVQMGVLLIVALVLVSCSTVNPNYCDNDERPCTDPDKPFCDIKGLYLASFGVNNVCIPTPRRDAGAKDDPVEAGVDSGGEADRGSRDVAPDSGDAGPDSGDVVPDRSSPAELQSDTVAHDLGPVPGGAQSALLTVTISNIGSRPTGAIAAAALDGTGAAAFLIVDDGCGGTVLDGGETCEVQLRFVPESVGARSAELTLSADPGDRVTIDLTGTGAVPAALQLETTVLDFGTVSQGTSSAGQLFTVRNNGGVATGAIDVSFDKPEHFKVTRNDCAGTLAPAATCDVQVAFAPKAVGAHFSTLLVKAAPGGQASAALSGTGKVALSVALGGTGQGTVTSTPPGIDCGTKCSADYVVSSVTLIARALGDSCFVGWSRGCSGTQTECTVTLDKARTVQANFNKPALLFTLRTTATGADSFDALVENTGCTLTWDMGDGSSRVIQNSVSHAYSASGEKTVTVLSPDGGAGVTLIDLSSESLIGAIPAQIGGLLKLKTLRLGNDPYDIRTDRNQLSGSIPLQFGQLSNLEELNLADNKIGGSIPAEIGSLINLRALNLGYNQLSGSVPDQLANLTKLEVLNLGDNDLAGGVPLWIGDLSNLIELDIWGAFTGSIPKEIGKLSKLEILFMGGKLSGPIPSELGNLSNLRVLELEAGDGQLIGLVPKELGNLSRLEILDLSWNQVTGVEPGALAGLKAISAISFRMNRLTQQAVDAIVDEIYQVRQSYPSTKWPRNLDLDGETNASPSPSTLTKIEELRGDTYKWDITVNAP